MNKYERNECCIRNGQVLLFKLTCFNIIITLRGWAVLSQICDYRPVSINAVLELAKFYLN